MPRSRKNTVRHLLTGLTVSILFTLLAMLALSAALVYTQMEDGTLRLLNQLVKLIAIVLGCCAAIPRGGEKGLATGVLLALIYIILGYICCIALGGTGFSFGCMLGEMLLGSAAGAVTGAIRVNLHPRRRRTKAA